MVQYDYIRFLFFNKGKSIRSIAKEMQIHRDTVRNAINKDTHKYHLTVDKVKPVNGSFEERIEYMIKENHSKPKKDRLTKKRMHELLQGEGYEGSYSAFTYQVRQIEEELNINTQEAFLKLIPLKGCLQVDFGEMLVLDHGVPRKVYAFCAKLCYSKVEFIQIYPRQSTKYFFEGLTTSFAFFGGIPKKIVFDNLKPAVKEVKKGDERVLQDEFIRFKAFYCFEAVFCGPAKGNEKGMVENLVKYTHNNYFLPYPEFTTFAQMNHWLMQKCKERMQTQKLEGRVWEERLLDERQDDFLPFKEAFDGGRIEEATVDSYQLIHIDRNRYSVPTNYVGRRIQIKLYPFEIVISYKEKIIAKHKRLFSENNEQLNPYHYLPLLQKKARAYEQAKVIYDWHLPDIYQTYHKQLCICQLKIPPKHN